MRFFFTLFCLSISLWLNAQFSCPISSYSLTSTELGAISNNTTSYTYSATTFSMPYSVVIQKVAGNGPNLYRYTSTTGVWIGKDNDDEGIQPPVQEYNDVVITFSGEVSSVYLDFVGINKNSDGEEQIQSIYPQTLAGANITTGVSYFYEPGVPSGTVAGTNFSNATKSIYAYSGNADNGRIHITSATPFRKIRFRWKELTDLSFSGPNGVVLNRIQYCPVLPEITCLYQNQTQAVVDTVIGPTLFPYQDSILSFTIRNVGSATLNLSNIQLSGNAYYQLLSPTSLSLAPAASSIISVRYYPLAIGAHVTNLLFQTNDFTEPNYNIRIQSQCSGPIITVENQGVFLSNPSSVSTSPTLLGQTDTLTFYIRNQGNTSLQVNSIQSTQSSQWTRLSTAPLNLASGQRDSFKVLYHPTVAGTSTLPVLILSNDYRNDSFRIVIQGISTQPVQISQSVCRQTLPLNWNGMSITQAGTYFYMSTSSQGFDSLTQLNLSVNNSDTVRLSQQICAQDLPYQWQQGQLTQSGTYQTLLSNRFGCDSLIILQLNVLNPPSTILFDSICENNTPYLWQNTSIYASGQYVDTLISAQGCDSLAYLNLHLILIPSDTVNLSICDNQLPYVWNQIPITQSGTYQYVQPGASACDSISVLRIQILQTDSTHLFMQECSNRLPLNWAGLQFTQAGTQSRTLTNRLGCDSVVYYTLQILPVFQTQLSQTVCQNDLPFSWNGIVFTQSGQDTVMLQATGGCDSLVQMTLNVLQTFSDTVRMEICSGDLPYIWGNQSYSQSGMFSQLNQSLNGCDSISHLILQVKTEDSTQLYRQECSNRLPLNWAGLQFTQAGTQTRILTNAAGCDSVVYYTLMVVPAFQTQLSQTVCQNDLPFSWNGIVFTQSGQNAVLLQAVGGCDSLVEMTLNVNPTFSDTVRMEICSGNLPFDWNGQSYNQSGFYTQMYQSSEGCDSIISLNLTVNSDTMLIISQRICQSQLPYTWNGQLFISADTITINYNSVSGCDSTIIMQLSTDSVYSRVVYRTVCQNELPLAWNGLIFNTAGTQLVNYNSIHFCDSLVSYQLAVLPTSNTQQILTINTNATPYFWNGLNITQSGIYTVQLTAANGCDSIVSLSIRVVQLTPPQIQVSYTNTIIQPSQSIGLPNLVVNQIYDFSFLVKNLGQSPLIISQISENQSFVQLYAGIQNAINQLQSDSFILRITPLQVGPQAVRVQINSTDPNIPIFVFNLVFKVINGPAPEIDLSYQQSPLANQATISMVNQPVLVGQTQLIQLAVQNTGTANLQLYQLLSNNPNVQIDPNYLNLLVPYAQTFIQLRYTPVQAGFELMKLTILNNDADESTTEIIIRLQAVQPSLPEIEVFIANQPKANQSTHFMGTSAQAVPVQQQLQIKNIGNAALQVSQISIINSQGFSLQGATSNLTINPGNVANLNLNFSSQTIGSFTATVNILNNDSNENPYQIRVQAQVLANTLPNCSQCNALNVLTNPLNEAEWIDNEPRLTWQHEEGLNIQYYRLEMWVLSNSSWSPVTVNGNLNNQVFPPINSALVVFQVNNGLSYFKEHKWRITAYDNQNLPISCFTRTFLTQKRPEVDEWTCDHPNVPNFGSELGQFNNVPIYKNGGCENGVYDPSSSNIITQYYNSNFYRNRYGWQCAELPPRYYKTRFKINAGPGNGVDYNLVTGNRKGFKRFENGLSTEPPTTDDILARNSYSHQYGHVVIAKGGPVNNNASSSFRIIQQNVSSNITAHISGTLPIKRQNGKYTITDRNSGIWLSWIRAKPELIVPGDDSSVPFVHSTTPDFRWARHSQIKGYQFKLYKLDGTCYRLEHDIRITGNNFSTFQIPALEAGETYKWTVENIFHVPNQTGNWNKRVKSMANYFRVSTLATANRTNVPLIAMGEEEQFLWMQTLGSSLSGAEIWFKNDEDWLYTASTEQQSANFLSSTYILPGDSLWISRKGYHDLKLSVETNLSARGKYYFPLFPKNSNPIKVDISASGHSLFVPANDIQLKLKGENYTNYQLFYDDVLHPEIYNYSDSIISIPYMEAGYQSVRVYAMNADDTLSVDYHFVVTDGTEEQMTLSLAMQKQQKVQVYLDRQFYAEINASQQFTLPRSHYALTLKGHGLESQNFEIESDSIIQVELNASPWIMNSQSFDLAADESVYFDVYASIISEGQSRVELSSDSSFSEDSIYLALSETLHFSRKSNDANNMQLKWIVDKQLPESELFLRWEENGTVQLLPLFEQNTRFTFEAETHLLHLRNISNDFNASIVQKKQRSIFDENDNTLHLFPNPNSGNFTLFIAQIEGTADIEIFDVLGRLVHSLKAKEWLNHTIEISNLDLSAGNYFVKLNTGEKTYLSKLRIKR